MKTNCRLIPSDTSPEAFVRQIEVLRKMSIEERATMTFELSDNLRSITESGIKQRHPDYTPDQIKMAWIKLTIEPELFKEAFPDCEIEV